MMNNSDCVIHCHGVVKDPETNNFMIVINYNEFNKCYIKYGVCEECKQPNTGGFGCQPCVDKHIQRSFNNWTSGNYNIDKFIQNAQLETKNQVLEWIEYDRFENVK